MTQRQALALVNSHFKSDGIAGIKALAERLRVPWMTVYQWKRNEGVPRWHLDRFNRALGKRAA
jgi:hypothetical protein